MSSKRLRQKKEFIRRVDKKSERASSKKEAELKPRQVFQPSASTRKVLRELEQKKERPISFTEFVVQKNAKKRGASGDENLNRDEIRKKALAMRPKPAENRPAIDC